jgi:hypothetical protein
MRGCKDKKAEEIFLCLLFKRRRSRGIKLVQILQFVVLTRVSSVQRFGVPNHLKII